MKYITTHSETMSQSAFLIMLYILLGSEHEHDMKVHCLFDEEFIV